jgi:hypothetical protein
MDRPGWLAGPSGRAVCLATRIGGEERLVDRLVQGDAHLHHLRALMGSLVGSTEANTRQALKIADAMSP